MRVSREVISPSLDYLIIVSYKYERKQQSENPCVWTQEVILPISYVGTRCLLSYLKLDSVQ